MSEHSFTCPKCEGTGLGDATMICEFCGGDGIVTCNVDAFVNSTKNGRVYSPEAIASILNLPSIPDVSFSYDRPEKV